MAFKGTREFRYSLLLLVLHSASLSDHGLVLIEWKCITLRITLVRNNLTTYRASTITEILVGTEIIIIIMLQHNRYMIQYQMMYVSMLLTEEVIGCFD